MTRAVVGPPRVDAYTSLRHYADHLLPVWQALPPSVRGRWYGPRSLWDCGFIQGTPQADPDPTRPMLVAGLADGQKFSRRPLILLEHGAGQTYTGDDVSARHGSYAGGDGWESAIGFLCPNERVAGQWRDRYPMAHVEVIGSPRLDRWRGFTPERQLREIVAFTFHWDCPMIPETRSALIHYRKDLPVTVAALRAMGFAFAGHAHPRWRDGLDRMWGELSVPIVRDLEDVMATASVLVADNTSALYEFAALGKPVVVLNAPWYRRDIEHGLRFWSAVPGTQVDSPAHLVSAITAAIDGTDREAEHREAVVRYVYGELDGDAAERAARAVRRMIA